MKPRPKLRRIVKWGATSLTVVLLALWVGSGWGGFGYVTDTAIVGWNSGQFGVVWSSGGDLLPGDARGWQTEFRESGYFLRWTLYTNHEVVLSGVPTKSYEVDGWTLEVAGWALALFPAIPATLLWRSEWVAYRRTLRGQCKKCNYDRRGLDPAAPCPECNTSITKLVE